MDAAKIEHYGDEIYRALRERFTVPEGFEIEYGWGGLLIDDSTWQVLWLPKPSHWGHEMVNSQPPTTIYPAR